LERLLGVFGEGWEVEYWRVEVGALVPFVIGVATKGGVGWETKGEAKGESRGGSRGEKGTMEGEKKGGMKEATEGGTKGTSSGVLSSSKTRKTRK
jgi:hypothetical protein